MSSSSLATLFASATEQPVRRERLEAMKEPRLRYVIAMTPRSGSSYLCDVMQRTHRLGKPTEAMNENLIPTMLRVLPTQSPDEFLKFFLRMRRSPNGVSGLKASWFQFRNFRATLAEPTLLRDFRYVYLTRADIAAQAVSLYKATESDVFHTNIDHGDVARAKLAGLGYDFDKIRMWHEHITQQEQGWKAWFAAEGVTPLAVTYEQIEADVLATVKRIGGFIGVREGRVEMPEEASVFRKVADDRNAEWSARFTAEMAQRGESVGGGA